MFIPLKYDWINISNLWHIKHMLESNFKHHSISSYRRHHDYWRRSSSVVEMLEINLKSLKGTSNENFKSQVKENII